MQRIEQSMDVCGRCQTDGGASTNSYFKIQFTQNKNYDEKIFPPINKFNFRIGEYCTGCNAWKKWTKQTPELLESFKDAILTF